MLMVDYFVMRNGVVRGPTSAMKLREMAATGKLRKDDGIRRGEDGEWVVAGTIPDLFDNPGAAEAQGELIKDPLANLAEKAGGIIVRAAGSLGKAAVQLGGTVKGAIARRSDTVMAVPTLQPPDVPTKHTDSFVSVESAVWIDTEIVEETTQCPFCAETVKKSAKQCKHCGEILDVVLRQMQQSASAPTVTHQAPAPPVIHITNVNTATANVEGGRRYKAWSPFVAALLSFIVPGLGQLYKGQPFNGFVWFVLVVVGYIAFIVPGIVLHICCILGAAMGDPYR